VLFPVPTSSLALPRYGPWHSRSGLPKVQVRPRPLRSKALLGPLAQRKTSRAPSLTPTLSDCSGHSLLWFEHEIPHKAYVLKVWSPSGGSNH
jgi:hypothetical protein